jgi:hypothetical protein
VAVRFSGTIFHENKSIVKHPISGIKEINRSILILLSVSFSSGYRLGIGYLYRYCTTRFYFLLQQFVKSHRSLSRCQEISRSSGSMHTLLSCLPTVIHSDPVCFNRRLAKIRLDEAGLDPFHVTRFNILSNHGRSPIIHVETWISPV